MLKNIERKQKLFEEKRQIKQPTKNSSQLLFTTQFIKEINEMAKLQEHNKVHFVTTKQKSKGPQMIESIISMMSRVVDESGLIASRIDTQFSDLTLLAEDTGTMQSFLDGYNAETKPTKKI